MRAYLPGYELIAPPTLPDALRLLEREPGEWKPLAGGTDLMVLLEAGQLRHRKFFSIWSLRELQGIEASADHITLGARTTYTQVLAHPILQQEFPLLCQAARETGGIATQNRGTLGGNIVNASPAADSPPALLVYDAELELVSARGSRWVPYQGFHTGYKHTILRLEELLARIRLPRPAAGWSQYYRKVGTRNAQAISKVVLAGRVQMDREAIRDIRIALGSVAPMVVRCPRTEAVLRGRRMDAALIREAQQQLANEISPIDDMRSTAQYRRRIAVNLLAELLQTP